jgi:hypothetical protein
MTFRPGEYNGTSHSQITQTKRQITDKAKRSNSEYLCPNSTIRTSWPTCCATSTMNLLDTGKTSVQQIVQLVGCWSCQCPTNWLSGVYQPTSCTTSSCLVHQTRTCWSTCSYSGFLPLQMLIIQHS